MSDLNPPKPKTYIISIAVQNYLHLPDLPNATRGAESVLVALERDYEVIIFEKLHDIKDDKPIRQAISNLQKDLEPEDALLIIYNGHGEISKKGNIAYWQFQDSDKDNESTWYKCSNLFDDIKKLNIKDVAVFVNACYSGNLFSQDGLMERHYDEGGKRSRILLTSGVKSEKVSDDNPFSDLIVEALGKYKNNLKVSLRRIIDYVIVKNEEKDVYSRPRDGYFREHEGGQFILLSRNQEKIFWDIAKDKNTIESYEEFLEKFSDGEFSTEATLKKDRLVKENDDWLNMLKDMLTQVEAFKKRDNLSNHIEDKLKQLHQQIEKLRKDVSENVDDYEEWSKVRTKNNDIKIPNSEKIKTLKLFIKNHSKNIYVKDAESRLKRLKDKANEAKAWENIPPKRGFQNIAHRRSALFEYIKLFYNSKRIDEANEAYKGILLIEKAIEFFDKEDFKKSSALFKRYMDDFPKGEYFKNAKQKLEAVNIVRVVNEQREILEQAIKDNDIPKIYGVVDYIDGLTPQERKEAEDIYKTAKSKIQGYEKARLTDFEKASKSDRVQDYRDFINKYEQDDRAIKFVDEMRNILLDKDTELFNIGEYQTQNAQDFKYYIEELGEEGGRYTDAKDRIAELDYFSSLENKNGYQNYLDDYPNGLKREDATNRIFEIEQDEEQLRRYEEAINSSSIDICQAYLSDYEDVNDDNYKAVNKKYLQLKEQEEEKNLFEQIIQADQLKKFNLCARYLAKFNKQYRSKEIKEISEKVKSDIDSDVAFKDAEEKVTEQGFIDFENAVKEKNIDYKLEDFNIYLIQCFENFKGNFNSGRNHEKADDYILYLQAKQSKKREDFEYYLQLYKDKDGLNIDKVKDGLLFLDAYEKKTIEALSEYLRNSKIYEFKREANKAINQLQEAIKIKNDFDELQNFDGDIDKAIKLCNEYLLKHQGYDKNYDKLVNERKSKLTYQREDDKDGKEALRDGSNQALIKYLKKYEDRGRHYQAVTQLLRENQLGITEKDKDVLDVVKDLASQIQQQSSENTKSVQGLVNTFVNQMEKSSSKNTNTINELFENFSKRMISMEEAQKKEHKKERRNLYIVIFVLFVMTIIIIYLVTAKE